MAKLPLFITGNQNKADFLSRTLGMTLEHRKLDLDEIQSANPQDVIEHKIKQAYDMVNVPVLVEDTSLSFNALGGLPGPFVKFFVDAPEGLEKMCRMIDPFDDRSAYACATYGYYDGIRAEYFSGRLNGSIALHPRGDGGYGWDPIFEPEGFDGKTRAELSHEDDIRTYELIRDHDALRRFLETL